MSIDSINDIKREFSHIVVSIGSSHKCKCHLAPEKYPEILLMALRRKRNCNDY